MAIYTDASASTSYADTGLRGPVPRDARLIALILSSMGVSDVEPSVLLQLLEFAHRYTYDVLSDALVYSDHANSRQAGSNLSLEDVNLAIQSRVNYSFTNPPEKDMLLALASTVNSVPLPPISDRHGVRLPEREHCLTNVNFGLVPNKLPDGWDEFEEQREAKEKESQSTAPSNTQASTVFDTNTTRRSNDDEDYDEDDEEEEVGDDGDVSMTTVHPSQSQQAGTQEGEKDAEATDAARGVKRSLDEDEEYD
ncbi:Transcription initiation factor TAFII31 [Kalmanozyma brasiliensis GHG001]|uniref:Uncharacterized protein n=1 Tax=Kalmanozyma brasiliensis (strain GHG001) TaxID=1365824 RepID=V5EPF4_KALBG|nr:Transcription initiation factor TAFII31 [Kalmanozyma brasiliensis GHG001]EST06990.1 Transcription initiation factor TAFII31 [Kalmanozyma brasiliensis GHG001]